MLRNRFQKIDLDFEENASRRVFDGHGKFLPMPWKDYLKEESGASEITTNRRKTPTGQLRSLQLHQYQIQLKVKNEEIRGMVTLSDEFKDKAFAI